MEINWVILGWLIDMLLNGFVWLVIAAIFLTLIDLTDTWTRKVLKLMDKADIWIRISKKMKKKFFGLVMEINWVILGWLIDMLLNGFVWLVIAAIFLTLIDL